MKKSRFVIVTMFVILLPHLAFDLAMFTFAATLRQSGWTDLHEIFGEGVE